MITSTASECDNTIELKVNTKEMKHSSKCNEKQFNDSTISDNDTKITNF